MYEGATLPPSCSRISNSWFSALSCACAPPRAAIAEADDVQALRRHELELGRGAHQLSQALGLGDVLVDEPAILVEPVLLERQPDLQRAEAARELHAVFAEPVGAAGQAARRVREVLRRERERGAVRAPIAHQDAAGLERHVQPLVQVERDRVGQLDALTSCAPLRGASATTAPMAPSTWNQSRSRWQNCASAARSSIAPVLMVPAVPITAQGLSPAARSAATAAASAPRSMR